MGIFRRPDSKFWWLWLETAPPGQQKVKTDVLVGGNTSQQREAKRLAEHAYHEAMLAVAKGTYGLQGLAPITFDAYADWWLAHVSVTHRGHERETEIVDRLRKTFGGDRILTDVTRDAVQEWMTARRAPSIGPGKKKRKAVSAGTVNRELDVLKQLLAAAVPRYLRVNPLLKMKRLRTTETEARVLSRADEKKLLPALAPDDRAMVLLALDCLLRLSDVVNLKREDDHETYLSIVNPKTTPYKVPVSLRVRRALNGLRKQKSGGPYYFARRRLATKTRDYRSAVKLMLQRACVKADVPYGRGKGITFHALRHTGATRMVEAGVPLRIVQAIGGWKSLRQLERYAHPSDSASRAAVETVGHRKRFA